MSTGSEARFEAGEKQLEQYLVEEPAQTMLRMQQILGGSERNATVAQIKERIAADQSPFGRAYADWFERRGLSASLDDLDAEMHRVYSASGSELDFDQWAVEFDRELRSYSDDPGLKAEMARLQDQALAEGRERSLSEQVEDAMRQIPGGERYLKVMELGLAFYGQLQEALGDSLVSGIEAGARPKLQSLDGPAAAEAGDFAFDLHPDSQ